MAIDNKIEQAMVSLQLFAICRVISVYSMPLNGIKDGKEGLNRDACGFVCVISCDFIISALFFLLRQFARQYSFINSLLTMVVQTAAPLLYGVSPLIS